MRGRFTYLLLTVRAIVQQPLGPHRFVSPLPLTERPLLDDAPSLIESSPPLPSTFKREPLLQEPLAAEPPLLGELAIDGRTRLVKSLKARSSPTLSVQLASAFRPGALVVINPGGTNEEYATVLRPEPLTLTEPLRYTHGVGEAVVQLALAGADAKTQPVSSHFGALLALRDRRAHKRRLSPPAAPPIREKPLLANVTQITQVLNVYVRTHVGVEAAGALLLAALLTLCVAGCVLQTFCSYSLCCFSRTRAIPPKPRELTSM